jgi:hypothetical protein
VLKKDGLAAEGLKFAAARSLSSPFFNPKRPAWYGAGYGKQNMQILPRIQVVQGE